MNFVSSGLWAAAGLFRSNAPNYVTKFQGKHQHSSCAFLHLCERAETLNHMNFVIFGLTLSSSWGNGHATLWRGLLSG